MIPADDIPFLQPPIIVKTKQVGKYLVMAILIYSKYNFSHRFITSALKTVTTDVPRRQDFFYTHRSVSLARVSQNTLLSLVVPESIHIPSARDAPHTSTIYHAKCVTQ
jgi:hypothetical protein